LGGTFAFELFLSADRLMAPGLNIALAEGHGLVGLFAAPLLAMAMVRNSDWRIDIHVSRRIVLHTAALVASGLFFLTLAAVGILVRQFGGSWGPALQLLTLLGSAIVLVSVLGSRDIRVHLKRIISRHFFTHRFDYRMEWLRFTETVTQLDDDESTLGVRVVRALAQIVDSPAGTLWCLQGDTKYVPEAGWNMPAGSAEKLFADDRFVAGFRGGDWIQQQPNGPEESWPPPLDRAWLGIPLSHRTELIGFVTLATPAQFYPLDWEAFDLLRAAGKQAASYLAEERSTRTLLDTRMLTDYSKRFAFVVHDMRNLAYQLGLVVGNARRYIDDREFRQSMLQTLEDSVAKMNRMLARLRTSGEEEQQQLIEPDFVIANLTQELSNAGMRIETRLGAHTGRVGIASEQFHSVLLHLINNACDASQPDCAIVVTSYRSQNKIIIDVVDSGPGMDEEFIRDELFRPFRSTKSDGLGIGAYQTRELLRMAGGELEVISKAGVGTTMRVILPTRDEARLKSTAA
jgi:putative PEP-CTERM system histidine kinase